MAEGYDEELMLNAPDNGRLKEIVVNVAMVPEDGKCVIYGTTRHGDMAGIRVKGSTENVVLPFVSPRVFVRYRETAESCDISVAGFDDGSLL